MEPPRRTIQKQISRAEVVALLNKLSILPYELGLSILYRLDYRRLTAVCEAIKMSPNSSRIRFSWMRDFCNDVNFWRDYLFEQGYDLPVDLPILIQLLKRKEETDLEVLKDLFFIRDGLDSRGRELKNLLNRYFDTKSRDPRLNKLSEDQIDQVILDFDYLYLQIINRRFRPGARVISIISNLMEDIEFPSKISFDDFVQWLVDYDISITIGSNLSSWSRSIWIPITLQRFEESIKIGQKLEEQSLAILPFLVREGDIVAFQVYNPYQDEVIRAVFYYVGPRNILYLVDTRETEEGVYPFIFPGIAQSFLEKNKIANLGELMELYPDLGDMKRFEFLGPFVYIKDGEKVEFPSVNVLINS